MSVPEPNRLQSHLSLPIPNPLFPTPFESLVEYLKESDISFESYEDKNLVRFVSSSEHGKFVMVAVVKSDFELFETVTFLPNHVPENKRMKVAEFCVRVNWLVQIGHLDLDFNDGELRTRVAVPFFQGVLPQNVIGRCLRDSVSVVNDIYPCIMAILHADVSPEDAFKKLLEDLEAEDSE